MKNSLTIQEVSEVLDKVEEQLAADIKKMSGSEQGAVVKTLLEIRESFRKAFLGRSS